MEQHKVPTRLTETAGVFDLKVLPDGGYRLPACVLDFANLHKPDPRPASSAPGAIKFKPYGVMALFPPEAKAAVLKMRAILIKTMMEKGINQARAEVRAKEILFLATSAKRKTPYPESFKGWYAISFSSDRPVKTIGFGGEPYTENSPAIAGGTWAFLVSGSTYGWAVGEGGAKFGLSAAKLLMRGDPTPVGGGISNEAILAATGDISFDDEDFSGGVSEGEDGEDEEEVVVAKPKPKAKAKAKPVPVQAFDDSDEDEEDEEDEE